MAAQGGSAGATGDVVASPVAVPSLPPHLCPSRGLASNTIKDVTALGPPKHHSFDIPEVRKKYQNRSDKELTASWKPKQSFCSEAGVRNCASIIKRAQLLPAGVPIGSSAL